MITTKFLFLTFCSFTLTLCADHNIFLNCSRVDFCNTLRNRKPSDDYTLDLASVSASSDSNILTATLKSNTGGSDLVLTLSGLQQNTFRLKITEIESSRYELQDVLDGEPEGLNFDNVAIGDKSVTVTTDSGSNSVVINASPFNIEFNKDGVNVVVFNGDQLTVSTNDVNAPFSFGVNFPEALQLYGLHEHCETLALRDTESGGVDPYRLKNLDVPYYEINSPMALYGAVPVLYGHSPRATAGIFLHNAAEQWVEISNNPNGGTKAFFMADSGTLDLFIFLGPQISEVVRQYTTITGRAHLPQLWTLGYHQSRNSYETQEEVKEIAVNFDSNNFQVDAIWLDIDYTDGFRYFTWNPDRYSDPVDLQDNITSTNKKLVTIIDPHVKVESGYNFYEDAVAHDYLVKNPNGSIFEGQCWPGVSSWMDFLNPDVRTFYANMYSYENFVGSTPTLGGIWNDMNEPSNFDTSLENTLPYDSLHIGDVRHREVHNIYGLLHTMSTHQGLLARDNNTRRPFILTRSHFAGTQRYSAIWTGDNQADWPYLHASVQECLNANLLGLVFCGADIGGFMGTPTNELLERWFQIGAWLPFYRTHSNSDTERREPYALAEETQPIVRDALQTRYKHIPVFYTLFYHHTVTGDPIIRPLFYQYPEDVNVYGIDNQFLLGGDILVCAVTEPEIDSMEVYFPGGENELWLSAYTDEVHAGIGYVNISLTREYLPVYYRRGAIILRRDTVRSNTAEMVEDSYTMYIIHNENNTAQGDLYVDDGLSFEYRDANNYNYFSIDINETLISFDRTGGGKFGITVDMVYRKQIIEMPRNGKPGKYKKTVFTTDERGVSLKNIDFNVEKTTVLSLK